MKSRMYIKIITCMIMVCSESRDLWFTSSCIARTAHAHVRNIRTASSIVRAQPSSSSWSSVKMATYLLSFASTSAQERRWRNTRSGAYSSSSLAQCMSATHARTRFCIVTSRLDRLSYVLACASECHEHALVLCFVLFQSTCQDYVYPKNCPFPCLHLH